MFSPSIFKKMTWALMWPFSLNPHLEIFPYSILY